MKSGILILSILLLTGCALKYVTPEPVISTFSPASGSPGTTVTILGSCFGKAPSVFLNGDGASVTSVSSTGETFTDKITFLVPVGAKTGKIKVTTTGGTSLSSVDFIVK